jgi:ABC-type transporter Mla subunit MlaD
VSDATLPEGLSLEAVKERFMASTKLLEELVARIDRLRTTEEVATANATALAETSQALVRYAQSAEQLIAEAARTQASARQAIEEASKVLQAEEIVALRSEMGALRNEVLGRLNEVGLKLDQIQTAAAAIHKSLPRRWTKRGG